MDDNVVAVKSEPVAATPSEPTPKGEGSHYASADETDMPLEIYEKENRDDYILKVLNMEDSMELLPTQEKESLSTISKYVKERMEKEGYEPTTKAYKDMFIKVIRELKIDKNVSRESLMDRVTGYIEAQDMIKEIKNIDEAKLLKNLRTAKSKDEMIKMVMGVVEKLI